MIATNNDDDLNEESDEFLNPENPEGIIAYGVWHKILREDGRLILVEVPMAQYRGQAVEEDEDEMEILELDDLSEAWMNAILEQGAALEDGESCLFRYPDEDDEDGDLEFPPFAG